MKIDFSATRYKFSILFVTLYAFFFVLLIALGFWQLRRADEKKHFIEKKQQAIKEVVIDLKILLDANPLALRYRKIALTGVYDDQHQFLIDNQIVNGRVGYFVLTPLRIAGIDRAILVNRGWLPLNPDRRIFPDISIATLKNNVTGRVNQFPSVGYLLADANIPTASWPSVVQVVDSQVLAEKLGYPLFPFQIELAPEIKEGYQREWQEIKFEGPEKHIAYAVQWFGLAATLTYLFIYFSKAVDE